MAREDIFIDQETDRPVLLIRGGTVVGEDLLPKLIRHGADPAQFILEYGQGQAPRFLEDGDRSLALAATNPMRESALRSDPAAASRNGILIVEPESRSLKRIMEALTVSGVRPGDLFPVRVPAHLETLLEKHHPALLFADECVHPMTSIFHRLKTLKDEHHLEHVVLTVSVPRQDSETRQALMEKGETSGIPVIFKPVNPFALVPVLKSYKARLALSQSAASLEQAFIEGA